VLSFQPVPQNSIPSRRRGVDVLPVLSHFVQQPIDRMSWRFLTYSKFPPGVFHTQNSCCLVIFRECRNWVVGPWEKGKLEQKQLRTSRISGMLCTRLHCRGNLMWIQQYCMIENGDIYSVLCWTVTPVYICSIPCPYYFVVNLCGLNFFYTSNEIPLIKCLDFWMQIRLFYTDFKRYRNIVPQFKTFPRNLSACNILLLENTVTHPAYFAIHEPLCSTLRN